MKRNILSVLLACLMIVSLCLMVGCKTDDLEAQIQENDAKQEGAVSDLAADLESDIKSAADTAAANLAEAQKKLEAMISSGDAVDAAALKAATAEFNTALAAAQETLGAAIDAAKKDASDANVALEASLEKAIDDAVAAVAAATEKKIGDLDTALKDAIAEGDSVLSAKVNSVAAELALLQETVLRDMVALDTILKQELTAKYDKVIKDLADAVAANLADAVAKLEKADADNKAAAEQALADAIEDYTAKINALNTALSTLDAKVDANKTELQNAIAALETSLTKKLNDAVAKLEAADAANKKAAEDALAAAIADYTAKIDALNTALSTLDAKVDANKKALEDAIAALETSLTKALNDAVAKLEAADAANKKAAEDALAAAIADYTAKIDALNTKVDENKTELQNAITALETSLTKALNDAVANLEAADAANKAAAEKALADAIADYTAKIDALNTALSTLDAKVDANKTELQNAITALEASLTKKLDDAVAALEAADATNKQEAADNLAAAIEDVNETIANVKAEASTALANLKTELEAKITEVDNYYKAVIETWNSTTETAADAIIELNTLYHEATLGLHSVAVIPVSNLYEAAKVRVIRAMEDDDVAAAVKEFKDSIAAVKAIIDVYTAKTAALDALDPADKLALDNIGTIFARAIEAAVKKEAISDTAKLDEIKADFTNNTDAILSVLATYRAAATAIVNVDADAALTDVYNAVVPTMSVVSADYATIKTAFEAKADALEAVDAHYAAIVRILYYADRAEDENDLVKIDALFADAIAAIQTADAPATVADTYKADVAKVKTKALVIRDIFVALNAVDAEGNAITSVVEFTPAWNTALTTAKTMIDVADDEPVVAADADFLKTVAIYEALKARYDVKEGIDLGLKIAEKMDALIGTVLTWTADEATLTNKAEVEAVNTEFTNWTTTYASIYADPALKEEVFGDGTSINNLSDLMARISELEAAKNEAITLDGRFEALITNIGISSIVSANKIELDDLFADTAKWVDDYFKDAYASEAVAGNGNYDLVEWDRLNAAKKAFDDAAAQFKADAQAYIDAVAKVPAVGDINLFSGDELAAAKQAYVDATGKLGKYDDVFKELFAGKTAEDVYNDIMAKQGTYNALVLEALANYETLKTAVDAVGSVTIYTTEYAEMLKWFDTYGVEDDEGNLTFTNVTENDGYVLSASLTVKKEDYQGFVDKQAEVKALVDAEKAEIQNVIDLINAIGTVTLADAAADDSWKAINDADTAYNTWLAGIDPGKDNAAYGYVIDSAIVTKLTDAKARYAALKSTADTLKADIAALATKTYLTIADDTERNTYETDVNDLFTRINNFEADNGADLVAFDEAKLNNALLEIAKYDEYVAITYKVFTDLGVGIVADGVVEVAFADIFAEAKNAIDNATEVATLNGSIAATANAKCADLITAYNSYNANYAAIANDEIKALAINAYKKVVADIVAGTTPAFNADAVYAELKTAADAYNSAKVAVETLNDPAYTKALVYDVAVEDLAEILNEIKTNSLDAAAIKFAGEKLTALETAVGHFKTAHAASTTKIGVESALDYEFTKIVDATGAANWTEVLAGIQAAFNYVVD